MASFRRYTNLAATVHLLSQKTITLLDPSTWDDKNDAFFMAEYKRITGARTVLALCFAEHVETYHHWRVFAHGNDGVCIDFDKDLLLSTFESDRLIRQDYVEYKTLKEASKMKAVSVERLPFLKRSPYSDEREYRVVYVNKRNISLYQDYVLDVGWIIGLR